MSEETLSEPFRAERGAYYWTIFGPDGKVGWGVEYSESAAASTVRSLTRAFEAGRATAVPSES